MLKISLEDWAQLITSNTLTVKSNDELNKCKKLPA